MTRRRRYIKQSDFKNIDSIKNSNTQSSDSLWGMVSSAKNTVYQYLKPFKVSEVTKKISSLFMLTSLARAHQTEGTYFTDPTNSSYYHLSFISPCVTGANDKIIAACDGITIHEEFANETLLQSISKQTGIYVFPNDTIEPALKVCGFFYAKYGNEVQPEFEQCIKDNMDLTNYAEIFKTIALGTALGVGSFLGMLSFCFVAAYAYDKLASACCADDEEKQQLKPLKA